MGGWEWVILLVAVPALIIGLAVRSSRRKASQQAHMWAEVFTADTVSYQLAWGAPPYDMVIAEAARRGYRLVQQSQAGLLTFTRQS